MKFIVQKTRANHVFLLSMFDFFEYTMTKCVVLKSECL